MKLSEGQELSSDVRCVPLTDVDDALTHDLRHDFDVGAKYLNSQHLRRVEVEAEVNVLTRTYVRVFLLEKPLPTC
jgi:hypothetical protein